MFHDNFMIWWIFNLHDEINPKGHIYMKLIQVMLIKSVFFSWFESVKPGGCVIEKI
jgi:hypothetical protein